MNDDNDILWNRLCISPLLGLQVQKQGLNKLSDKHHELVQPQSVNAKPLPPHGAEENSEVKVGNL